MAEPNITFSSDPNPSSVNQVVTFTVVVDGDDGPAASDMVTFLFEDSPIEEEKTLDIDGKAEMGYSFTQAGVKFCVVYYHGEKYQPAFRYLVQIVQDDELTDTTTTVNADPTSSVANEVVTFHVTVQSQNPAMDPKPSGQVRLLIFKGDAVYDGFSVTLGDEGEVNIVYFFNGPGTYTVVAAYEGDENYNASKDELEYEVGESPYTFNLTSNYNPSWYGQMVTFTFTVEPKASGNVSIYIDETEHYVSVVNGVATYQTATLTPGQHSVLAIFYPAEGGAFFVEPIIQTVLYCCCCCSC